jgi:hypothetical protein
VNPVEEELERRVRLSPLLDEGAEEEHAALAELGLRNCRAVRVTRRLLKSGFTQADATVAFLRDIDRREEEYRFEVGERVT